MLRDEHEEFLTALDPETYAKLTTVLLFFAKHFADPCMAALRSLGPGPMAAVRIADDKVLLHSGSLQVKRLESSKIQDGPKLIYSEESIKRIGGMHTRQRNGGVGLYGSGVRASCTLKNVRFTRR